MYVYGTVYTICTAATNYWVLPAEHAVRLHVSSPPALAALDGVGDDGLLGLLDGIVVAPPVRKVGVCMSVCTYNICTQKSNTHTHALTHSHTHTHTHTHSQPHPPL